MSLGSRLKRLAARAGSAGAKAADEHRPLGAEPDEKTEAAACIDRWLQSPGLRPPK
jgi:hypothetical protein